MAALPQVLRDIFARPAVPRPAGDIAVVVPLYNHERYIAAALRSVLAQTLAPREIVLIDDGSRDGGAALARQVLRDVPDCRVLVQDNAGAHATINRAVALTAAPYVAVLNSDDRFAPDKLRWCQEIIAATPDVGLIAGRVELIGARGQRLTRGPAVDWLARAEAFAERTGIDQLALLHENFVATTSNMVFSKQLWQRVGGFAALRACHDLEFLMRAYDHGRVVLDRARVHVQYRVHEHNTVHEDELLLRLEVAAVTAATLSESGARLLPREGSGFAALMEMLRARGIADLVLYLATACRDFDSRDAFLAFVLAEPNRARFLAHLRAHV